MNKSKPEPNFFYVNRELLHSDRWLAEPFTRGQAWVDLFGLAQYKKSSFRVRGIEINVERGQLAYSQLTLSKRWKWSRGKVKRYLKELEKNKDISINVRHQNIDLTTLITILKYEQWQGSDTPSRTPDGHQTVHQTDTYKNDKNVKNEKKEIHTPTPSAIMVNNINSWKTKGKEYTELIQTLKSKGMDNPVKEVDKFFEYWTELNKNGSKQRWQLQQTFEFKKRLLNWVNKKFIK